MDGTRSHVRIDIAFWASSRCRFSWRTWSLAARRSIFSCAKISQFTSRLRVSMEACKRWLGDANVSTADCTCFRWVEWLRYASLALWRVSNCGVGASRGSERDGARGLKRRTLASKSRVRSEERRARCLSSVRSVAKTSVMSLRPVADRSTGELFVAEEEADDVKLLRGSNKR